MSDAVEVHGLTEFSTAVNHFEAGMPEMVEGMSREAAFIVAAEARPRVPRKTGRAAKSLDAVTDGSVHRVEGGGRTVPYYRWLEFGGRHRPVVSRGRYVYPAYLTKRDEIEATLARGVESAASDAGL